MGTTVSTEIYGFDLQLEGCHLKFLRYGNAIVPPITLGEVEAEKLRLELAKAQLWEWNPISGN